jgi:hypothetical protein
MWRPRRSGPMISPRHVRTPTRRHWEDAPDGYGPVAVVRQLPKVRFWADLLAEYGQFYLMALITMNGGMAASLVDQPEGYCGRG